MWPVLTGVAGVFATWAAVAYLDGKTSDRREHRYWLLGLAGLFPAWLIAFLGLLQPVTQKPDETPLPPRALLSSGALLCGIIATDFLLRRLQKSGHSLRPVVYWIIGLVALLPAWLIALTRF